MGAAVPSFSNNPLGRTGFFIPPYDLFTLTATPTEISPGFWVITMGASPSKFTINLNLVLQRLLTSGPNAPVNAPLGQELVSGPLTGFDLLFMSNNTIDSIVPLLFENVFTNGKPISQLIGVTPLPTGAAAGAVYDPTLVLTPKTVPGLNTSGNVDVIQFRLAQPRIIARNLLDDNLLVEFTFTSAAGATIQIVGVQVYFQQEP